MEDFKRLFIESLGEEIAAKAFPALFGEENGITAVRFNSRKCAELQAVLPGGSTGSTDSTGSTGSSSTTGKVATGDSTNVAMLLLLLAAAAGVVVFARKRIKEN